MAFSGHPDSFGRVETPLKVDDWEPTKFFLSGLALSKSTHPAGNADLDSSAELFGDKVPLVSNGVQFIPSGTNHFNRREKASIYAEIYEPTLVTPNRKEYPELAVQMIVLEGKTGTPVKDFGITRLKVQTQPGNPAVPIGLLLSLVDLTPGSYLAQLTAIDSTGNRYTRTIGFELEP